MKGKISPWNDEKGYGFIEPAGGGKRIFVHIKAFSRRNYRPQVGQEITFSMSTDKQGRPCAVDARTEGDSTAQKNRKPKGSLAITGAAIFLIVVGISVLISKLPVEIFGLYVIASLITFLVYAMDKSAARQGNWRTQESTLHILSLIGGWPGALFAQEKLRHKSSKRFFRAVFWLTVIVNCGAFLWLLTPHGSAALRSVFAAVV